MSNKIPAGRLCHGLKIFHGHFWSGDLRENNRQSKISTFIGIGESLLWFIHLTWLLQKDFFPLSPVMFLKLLLVLHFHSVSWFIVVTSRIYHKGVVMDVHLSHFVFLYSRNLLPHLHCCIDGTYPLAMGDYIPKRHVAICPFRKIFQDLHGQQLRRNFGYIEATLFLCASICSGSV